MEYSDLEVLFVVRGSFGVSPCAGITFYEVTRYFAVSDDCLHISLSDSKDHRRSISLVPGLHFENVASE